MKTCKHFNGAYHNTCCDAGVEYKSVTNKPDEPGSAYRMPCHQDETDPHALKVLQETGPKGVCEKFIARSAEEIAAEEASMQRHMGMVLKTLTLCEQIKLEHEGEDWVGEAVCPVCGNTLHVSHAGYNGHIRAVCDTDDCVNFME